MPSITHHFNEIKLDGSNSYNELKLTNQRFSRSATSLSQTHYNSFISNVTVTTLERYDIVYHLIIRRFLLRDFFTNNMHDHKNERSNFKRKCSKFFKKYLNFSWKVRKTNSVKWFIQLVKTAHANKLMQALPARNTLKRTYVAYNQFLSQTDFYIFARQTWVSTNDIKNVFK